MGKRNNSKKTTKMKTAQRTVEAIRADLALALALEAEHKAVEACSKGDDRALARGWAAAERTNVLYRELASVSR